MEWMIRQPAVSGVFYHSHPHSLRNSVNAYIDQANIPESLPSIRGIIVPHAAYFYSGGVAACAYKALKMQENKTNFTRVILLGPAHFKYVPNPVTDLNTWWKTPLGQVHLFNADFPPDEEAHRKEHCLEVQLPFLQTILPKLEIMPLLISDLNDHLTIADKIISKLDNETLLLISSDLSHYYSYEEAIERDKGTLTTLVDLDIPGFLTKADACGKAALRLSMEIAIQCRWKVMQLAYQNSGDISGDRSSVVGYSSLAFYA
jgi:MEMO1 family protein